MRVASYGYVDCLNMLSQIETINWNLKNHDGWTAAMHAVMFGGVGCIKVLSKIDGIDWKVFTNKM